MDFDAILVDAPCSGLGTLRRNPEIKWRFDPENFVRLQSAQKAILNSVASSVKKGGFLLYSTCSTEPEENEDVVHWFLDHHTNFRLEKPAYPKQADTWLDNTGLLRTYPSTRLWDAFFAALIFRKS
jgi:16S rRNA (cytosine967-C5)-methyltransferase